MTVWLNIDRPRKICTIHSSSSCRFLKRGETAFKGVGRLKRDGGWLNFTSLAKAEEFCDTFPDYIRRTHC